MRRKVIKALLQFLQHFLSHKYTFTHRAEPVLPLGNT